MNPAFSGWRSYTLVEVPILLFAFSEIFAGPATTWLVINRGRQYLWENDDNGDNSADYVNNILTCSHFVNMLVPALLMFFLGPWSDRYGRKPLLVAAYAGSAMSFLLWSVLSSLGPFNPWIFLVACMPADLVGGFCTVTLATYCYITDIRRESDRVWHFIWLQSVISIGQCLGHIAFEEMYNNYRFATIFGVAAIANAIATIYILVFVPESATPQANWPWGNLFDPSSIKDIFMTYVRKRDGFDRILIWCCVGALTINVLIGNGELNIIYRFTLDRLGWTGPEYFWYLIALVLLMIAGTILGGLICKALIDQTMASMSIALLANYSGFLGSIAKACTIQSWQFYLSTLLGILSGLSGPVIQNALSKSAPPREVGKVFSLMASMKALITIVAIQFYNMVYVHDKPTIYPAPVYLVSAGLYACTILIVLTIKWRISKLFVLNHPPSTVIELQRQ